MRKMFAVGLASAGLILAAMPAFATEMPRVSSVTPDGVTPIQYRGDDDQGYERRDYDRRGDRYGRDDRDWRGRDWDHRRWREEEWRREQRRQHRYRHHDDDDD